MIQVWVYNIMYAISKKKKHEIRKFITTINKLQI